MSGRVSWCERASAWVVAFEGEERKEREKQGEGMVSARDFGPTAPKSDVDFIYVNAFSHCHTIPSPSLSSPSPPLTKAHTHELFLHPLQPFKHISIMSGGKSGGKAGGDKSKAGTRSSKAGLQFPVGASALLRLGLNGLEADMGSIAGRIHRLLRRGNYAQRVGAGAPGEHRLNVVMFTSRGADVDLQSTSLPSSSICRLRSSSSLATLLAITRRAASSPVTCSSRSATTRSSTSSSATSSSRKEVSCPRSSPSSCRQRARRATRPAKTCEHHVRCRWLRSFSAGDRAWVCRRAL